MSKKRETLSPGEACGSSGGYAILFIDKKARLKRENKAARGTGERQHGQMLERIEEYWTNRAEGYSQVNQEELATDQKNRWLKALAEAQTQRAARHVARAADGQQHMAGLSEPEVHALPDEAQMPFASSSRRRL